METLPEDYMQGAHPPNRTGAVLVDMYAIGMPGVIGMVISNVGPVEMSDEEILRTLKSAVKQVESKINETQ